MASKGHPSRLSLRDVMRTLISPIRFHLDSHQGRTGGTHFRRIGWIWRLPVLQWRWENKQMILSSSGSSRKRKRARLSHRRWRRSQPFVIWGEENSGPQVPGCCNRARRGRVCLASTIRVFKTHFASPIMIVIHLLNPEVLWIVLKISGRFGLRRNPTGGISRWYKFCQKNVSRMTWHGLVIPDETE